MSEDQIVKFLNDSLIYQMSLGSKELYHSNIWGWLILNDKEFIKAFIPDFDLSLFNHGKSLWPEREEKNRDILIWCEHNDKSKCHIVIENKIKTLPSIDQLKKYTVQVKDSPFECGVLTGIGPCPIDFGNDNVLNGKWSYVSYEEISKRIKIILGKSTNTVIIEHKNQILEYCEVVDAINKILADNINKHENVLTYSHSNELDKLRINDVFIKHKASQFVQYLKSKKCELDPYKPAGFDFSICQGFNNGKATIDVKFSNCDDKKPNDQYQLLGVQIEENQFRIIAEKNAKAENLSPDDIFNQYKNTWFDTAYNKNSKP